MFSIIILFTLDIFIGGLQDKKHNYYTQYEYKICGQILK